MEIINHWLKEAAIVESPNQNGEFAPGDLDTLIIHFTSGPNAISAIKTLIDPTSKASAHLVIGRDESVTQLVPFNKIAWHAGKSQYGGRTGFNRYSIGIEIDNAGELTKSGDVYRAWFGQTYPPEQVVKAIHKNHTTPKYWHAFTQRQIELVDEISRLLVKTYHLKFILGHDEISPGRKVDPGPAFPLDKLRDRILHPDQYEDEAEDAPIKQGKVIVHLLNIRKNPSINADKVTDPLPVETKVKILEEKGEWYKVSTEVKGWVNKKFVEITKHD